ncbi:MAG: hypothetical protein E7018_00345 [Alphaproteobacteria bacterium]|nr:hypothetical protein [Alphaproteobacteria bacterium]
MSTTIGYSSELYFIEAQDVMGLEDNITPIALPPHLTSEVVVLLGNDKQGIADTLISGREKVQNAIQNKQTHIGVRFAFISNISRWNLPAIFFKGLRQHYKFQSPNIYHISLNSLRSMHIERGFRNAQNAYAISKRWKISPEERVNRYQKLSNSIKQNGFDDKYPIAIMLCRRCGIKDCVDDGHHRIGICVENGIERIAIRFRAAGSLSLRLQNLCLKFINLFPKKTN